MAVDNRPGLDAIAYRVGTHARFRASLFARLSSADYPALSWLRTRELDDPTIALLDAFATMADVLTFYQERIANECFIRTATELGSLTELTRLIGYRPKPGVAAAAQLAFRLQETPGQVAHGTAPVTIPIGTKVQSVPGPDERPQTFETVEPVTARVEWNAIPVQSTERQRLSLGLKDIYLAGITTQLKVGDVVLLVGAERRHFGPSNNWDARIVQNVEPQREFDRTRVTWADGLGHKKPLVFPAKDSVEVFAFRQRAKLFGHNAPDARLLSTTAHPLDASLVVNNEWVNFDLSSASTFALDASYPKVIPGSWVVLVNAAKVSSQSALGGYVELYRASAVSHLTQADFALSSETTRVTPDTLEHLGMFDRRNTFALIESEALQMVERPLEYPVFGARLDLGRHEPDLAHGRTVAVTGKRQRLRVAPDAKHLWFVSDDGAGDRVAVEGGDLFVIAAPPVEVTSGSLVELTPTELGVALNPPSVVKGDGTVEEPASRTLQWRLINRAGMTGTLEALASQVSLEQATKEDPVVAEFVVIQDRSSDRDRTSLTFATALATCYDRTTVALNANVATATHGESVEEVLGSGNAAATNQAFLLKQAPLTWVSAPTPTGRASTLHVRVNGLEWRETPTLYGHQAQDRGFVTRRAADGATTVQFGDGGEGARLPTGQGNLRAQYRKGLGLAGNVGAGQLTTLLSRPLGVQEVTNPIPATGGEDPESIDDLRRNAPLGVLTLDRAVSLLDYENFARGFAGIAKAFAVWVPNGPARGVFLTIAGYDGKHLPPDSPHRRNLALALRGHGDPQVPIRIASYRPVAFRVQGSVKVAAEALVDDVLAQCRAVLRTRFGFAARDFGQIVSIDEVLAMLHSVEEVVAADLDALYLVGGPVGLRTRLPAALPDPSASGGISAAEILTIDPDGVELGAMT